MDYSFFDYKGFIEGYHGQDYFGKTHLIAMAVLTALIVVLLVTLRKTSHKSIDTYLKVLSIIVPVLEIVKIVWESYWDITFNFYGD